MPPEPAPAPRHETLLEHRAWVRALARSLVERSADADDVEQQTWVAALDAAPADARSMRAWLATVARNAARKLHRGEGRRRRREAASDPRGPSPSAAALAEQAEVHARVVAAVVALDEPYREAVLLRHFEGLGVSDAADRAGVPLETMRARLRRARDMLRARLGEEFGPERPWRLALLPLLGTGGRGPLPQAAAGTGAGTAAAVVGGTIMGTKVIAGVVAAALVVSVVWLTGTRDPDSARETGAAPRATTIDAAPAPRAARNRPRADAAAADDVRASAPDAPAPVAAVPELRVARRPTIRERLAEVVPPVQFAEEPALAAFGRLAEATSIPIVVAREAADRPATGLVDLAFDEAVSGQVLLDVLTRVTGFAYVIEDERVVITPADGKRDAALAVVVPPRPAPWREIVVRGRVVDASGTPVVGAEIRHPARAEGSGAVIARSNASGDFEATVRPPFRDLQARAPGHVPSGVFPVGPDPAKNGTFLLELRGAGGDVTVRVVTGTGPAADAYVRVGADGDIHIRTADGRVGTMPARTARTDAEGIARFAGVPVGKAAVRASLTGFDVAARDVDVVADRTTEVEVRLVPKPALADMLAKTRVSLEFKDARVDDVVGFLSRVGNVNIVVLPAAAERAATTPVSLSFRDEPLDGTLRALCDAIGGVTYEIRGDVVCIDAVKK